MEMENKGLCRNMWAKVKDFINHKAHQDDEEHIVFIHLYFIDLCIYFTFLTVTTVFTMSTRDVSMHHFGQVIEGLFVRRPTYNEQDFELTFSDLVTVDDWWSFVETTFLESIAQFRHQNEKNGLKVEEQALVGLPRLRQIRVHNETCTMHDAFRNQFRTCYGKYSKDNEDVSGFINKTHLTINEINTLNIWGKITTYYGGGYIEPLSLELEENMEVLHKLKNSSWIDRGTRVILIEFALFNANVNLFCNVKLLAEIPPSGGILTSTAIQPLKYSALCRGYFECICAIMFYVLILYYTLEMVLTIILIGFGSFCCSLWTMLDFVVIMFGYYSLFYIIWHTIYLNALLDNNAEKNISLDVICYWNMVFVAAMGICVFIVWIKIFKYIKLNKTILQFSTTLRKCAKDLIGFAIMFAIVFIAYADLSLLLFGTVHGSFRDFPTALLTMFRMVLGDFNYEEMEEANAYLAPIFFLSYILFVFFILLNMFLAIVNDTYSEVKAEITEGKGNNFEQYMKALVEKLRNHILCNKENKNSINELEEFSIPPEEIILTELKSSNTRFLNSWFEIISLPRTPEEQGALIQRIAILEKSLKKLVESLDKLLKKMNSYEPTH